MTCVCVEAKCKVGFEVRRHAPRGGLYRDMDQPMTKMYFEAFTQSTPSWFKVNAKSAQSQSKVRPKLARNWQRSRKVGSKPEVGPKLARSQPQVTPKTAHVAPKTAQVAQSHCKFIQTLASSPLKVGRRSTKSWPEVVLNSAQSQPKVNPPKLTQSSA